ncbi:hypothetical protein I302_105355 [Kwoniella bestiolae CBS 10118]|uniref:F-box domain-containing protein n=1 Tax=Kwoniella bestiolae CBS 10118 TaxID=1296100 RepID=A0A1B9FSY0_9TREE|nr:hypothetical protein I302_08639 [Kwoniella bestiolae CBS 10118]OCF21860.1 hypothetical protein I302_08639 [Kwoniella bestiolae CBS 10118]
MMILSDLPDEILASISSCLYRPPPDVGTPATRTEFHQHDLTSLLRVNKRFFHIASKVLYTHPVVDDPRAFLCGISSSNRSLCKIDSIKHVRHLDIQHRHGLRDEDEAQGNRYVRMDIDERAAWETKVLEGTREDLENCQEASALLEQLRMEGKNVNLMPNLEILRIGAWDGGWWVKVMKEVIFDHTHKEARVNSPVEDGSTSSPELYDEIMTKHPDSFKFASALLKTIRPKAIIQYIQAGPLSLRDALSLGILDQCYSPEMVSHLNFDIDRNTINFHPTIVIGSYNRWCIKCTPSPLLVLRDEEDDPPTYIDEDGLMVALHILLQHISRFNYAPDTTPTKDTVLEVYDLGRLEYKEYDEMGNVAVAAGCMWIGRDEEYASNDEDQSGWPGIVDDETRGARRFGPWGMMEVTRKGVRFIDVRSEELRLTVMFKISSDTTDEDVPIACRERVDA